LINEVVGEVPLRVGSLGHKLEGVFLNLGRTHEYGNHHMCMGMQEHIKIGGSSLGIMP
jgi:hypothetical protein